MKKNILKKKTFKKGIWSIVIIISLILIFMFLETINTVSCSESQYGQVLTIIDADPSSEDEEIINEAIKMSITPMNMNSNEYITVETD